MIAAVIVLLVIALALGGYIAFDALRGRKSVEVAEPVEHDYPQVIVEKVEPQAAEAETADTDE